MSVSGLITYGVGPAGSIKDLLTGGLWPSTADVTVALTGISSTVSPGTVVPSSTVATTGAYSTVSAGTIAPAISTPVTGIGATSSAGSVTQSASVALTGPAVTASPGTIAPSSTVDLTGSSATASAGTVTANTGSDVTVALTGIESVASAGTVVVDAPVIILVDESHDGKKPKRKTENFKRAAKAKADRRKTLLDAYEAVLEGKPEVAVDIARPYFAPPTKAAPFPVIDVERLLEDVNAVERIMREYQELDDEEAMAVLL